VNRDDLKNLSRVRITEARVLLNAGHYAGAYYLAGYSVECALKACISRKVKRYDFPDKKLANDSFTHNLVSLVNLAGLQPNLTAFLHSNSTFAVNWALAKDWSEAARYSLAITRLEANDMYSACTSRTHGVLPWIRKVW